MTAPDEAPPRAAGRHAGAPASHLEVVVHPDAAALAEATAARLLIHLLDRQSLRAPLHVVLTGGTAGTATLRAIAASPVRDAVDWSGVHVWWGDERFVPADSPDRNERQAREALLDALPIPADNVHAMPAQGAALDEHAAATWYAAELARFGDPVPRFDVLLLGVGPDGHVASLFPGHATLHERARSVVGEPESPKPPPHRVSLTFPAIRAAREVWLVVAGQDKADAVARALSGSPVDEIPAAGALGAERTLWLVDVSAASTIPVS
ncbi:MAG TPA: 6-phosphogluconolactonase [Cellulomonas sp.]